MTGNGPCHEIPFNVIEIEVIYSIPETQKGNGRIRYDIFISSKLKCIRVKERNREQKMLTSNSFLNIRVQEVD